MMINDNPLIMINLLVNNISELGLIIWPFSGRKTYGIFWMILPVANGDSGHSATKKKKKQTGKLDLQQ